MPRNSLRSKIKGDHGFIENPFQFLAHGLSVDPDDVWEEKPVDIVEFIESKEFLNLKYNPITKRGCRPKIMEIAIELTNDKVREAILLLGKGSIPGETLITMEDGRQVEIAKLYDEYEKCENPIRLVNHDTETLLSCVSLGVPKYSGRKKIYRIRLSDGSEFETSMNHKMVTYNGYERLEDLGIGSEIAVLKDLSIIKGKKTCTNKEARFLGYMIANGFFGGVDCSGCDRTDRYSFITTHDSVKNDFIKCLKSIDPDCDLQIGIEETGVGYRDKYHINFYGTDSNTIFQSCIAKNADILIKSCGLHGKRSADKFVPDLIKTGTKKIIGNFIAAYWTCDGEVNNGRKNPDSSYYYSASSKSRKLMEDVHYLLKRIGVYTRLRTGTKYVKCIGRDYTASGLGFCSDYNTVLNFYKYVRLRGYKRKNQKRSLVNNNKSGKGTNKKTDGCPESVNIKARQRIENHGDNYGTISHSMKKCYYTKRINNKILNEIEETYGGDRDFVDGNVTFEEIVSIEYVGVKDAYDITILCGEKKNLRNYSVAGSVLIGNSGKDFISSIIHLYGIYKALCMYSPQSYYALSPKSSIYFINVARNEIQAKNVFFKEFLGHLENCAWFEGKYLEPGTQQVTFMKNIVALSGNSQAFGWLGYNTIQWVGDEIAFFLQGNQKDEDAAESKAEECWEAAFGSCKTRFPLHYKMIGITTPRFDDDFVMKKFYELQHVQQTEGTAYVRQEATWDIHPGLTIADFKTRLEQDYRRVMRDFGAQPMGVIETFWGDPDFVDKNPCEICRHCPVYQNREIDDNRYACREFEGCMANGYMGNGKFREWMVPDYEKEYYMHFDLSKNKDRTGFTLCHIQDWIDVKLDPYELLNKAEESERNEKSLLDEESLWEERPLIKVDFIGWIDPKGNRDPELVRNGEIYYIAVLRQIVWQLLDKGFNIAKLTVDQYQCLVGNTLVSTNRGILNLSEVCVGDQIATRVGKRSVTGVCKYDNADLVQVVTEHGYWIEGTPNHRIEVSDGSGGWKWKELGELTIADELHTIDHRHATQVDAEKYVELDVKNIKHGRSVYQRYKDLQFPCFLNEDFAELLGIIWGDGNFELDYARVGLSISNEEYEVYISQLIEKVFSIKPTMSSGGVRFGTVAFREFWKRNGFLKPAYSKEISIPSQIFESPKSVVASFIRGLFGTDGSANKHGGARFTTYNQHFAYSLKYLLVMKFGIQTNVVEVDVLEAFGKKYEYGEKTAYHVDLIGSRKRFWDEIGGFGHPGKNRKFKEFLHQRGRYSRERVVEVNWIGKGTVYDLEVDGDHTYVANGLISHNSHMFKQTIEDYGIDTDLLSLDRTDEVPATAKNCFIENRVEYPYDYTFAREARHLKYINGNKVDHPNGHGKDIIDSVFGSVYNAQTAQAGNAAFEMACT